MDISIQFSVSFLLANMSVSYNETNSYKAFVVKVLLLFWFCNVGLSAIHEASNGERTVVSQNPVSDGNFPGEDRKSVSVFTPTNISIDSPD